MSWAGLSSRCRSVMCKPAFCRALPCLRMLLVLRPLSFWCTLHPSLVTAAGPGQEAVVGFRFPFPLRKNIWEGWRKKGGEELLKRSQGEGDVCRRPVARWRSGGSSVLLSQGNDRCAQNQGSEGGHEHSEWEPCVPPLHTTTCPGEILFQFESS